MAISSVLIQIARKSKTVLPPIAQRLRDKVALITGAANGFGPATAKLFARHGAKVILADIQDDLGRSIVQEINVIGSGSFLHCNMADEISVRTLVDAAVTQHGKLDILFSNIGTVNKPSGSIHESDPNNMKNDFDMNVLGAYNCAKHVARVMAETETKGSILLTARVPHAYTSKNAVMGLITRGIGVELGKHGIRVNCISSHPLPEDMILDATNLKETMTMEDDVAKAGLYLASDEAKYVSGVNLIINGGYKYN